MSTTLSLPKENEATQTVGQNHKRFHHWSLRVRISGDSLVIWIWLGFDVKLSSTSKIMSKGQNNLMHNGKCADCAELEKSFLTSRIWLAAIKTATSSCNKLSWKHGTGVMNKFCPHPLWKMTPWQPKRVLRVCSSFMSCFRVQIKQHLPSFSSLKELLYM